MILNLLRLRGESEGGGEDGRKEEEKKKNRRETRVRSSFDVERGRRNSPFLSLSPSRRTLASPSLLPTFFRSKKRSRKSLARALSISSPPACSPPKQKQKGHPLQLSDRKRLALFLPTDRAGHRLWFFRRRRLSRSTRARCPPFHGQARTQEQP